MKRFISVFFLVLSGVSFAADKSTPNGVARLACFGGGGSFLVGGGTGKCKNMFSSNTLEYSTRHQAIVRRKVEAAGLSNDITSITLVSGGASVGLTASSWELSCNSPHPWTGNYVGGGIEVSVILGANVLVFTNSKRTCVLGGPNLGLSLGIKGSYLRIRQYRAPASTVRALNDGTMIKVLTSNFQGDKN